MSARAEALADELQLATDDVAAFLEEVSPEGWLAFCEPEQCTVAALVCHIGNSYTGMMDHVIKPVVAGEERPPLDPEALHAWNAQAAQIYATASKDLAREVLAQHAPPVIAFVRGLSDEQLDTTFEAIFRPGPISIADMINGGLIGHPRGHLASARAASGLAE